MNTPSIAWDALAGQYQLRPGQQPGVLGQRPVLGPGRLAQLLAGQRGEQVGATLSSVFTLCAHAHRRAGALALVAAHSGKGIAQPAEPPVLLWVETARDHLRAMALDWQPDAATTAPDLAWLRGCPLSLASRKSTDDATAARHILQALRAWLQDNVLYQPVDDWLRAHRQPDALAGWCWQQAAPLAPARHLARWHAKASVLTPACRFLDVLDLDGARQTNQLQQLGQGIANDAHLAQQPVWLGQCAETGAWTRLRQRPMQASLQHTAWTRLAARWRELVEIAAANPETEEASHADHAPLLSSGALPLAEGQALAWCEMARGLLLHWVQLDARGGIQDYRVVAPTEWNFHPAGALARAVAALAPDDADTARVLAAAYDPCVACTVQATETKLINHRPPTPTRPP